MSKNPHKAKEPLPEGSSSFACSKGNFLGELSIIIAVFGSVVISLFMIRAVILVVVPVPVHRRPSVPVMLRMHRRTAVAAVSVFEIRMISAMLPVLKIRTVSLMVSFIPMISFISVVSFTPVICFVPVFSVTVLSLPVIPVVLFV
jgi:hypothetical protein